MKGVVLKKLVTWLKKRKVSDWLFVVIVLFALFIRGPGLVEQFSKQGSKLSPIVLDGKLFPPPATRSVLVFWASWCGPCTIELNRIHSAIEKKRNITYSYLCR
jgi:cytochrome c biogenesis protein CcmG/thiol:disulfide interchange protein DsbE